MPAFIFPSIILHHKVSLQWVSMWNILVFVINSWHNPLTFHWLTPLLSQHLVSCGIPGVWFFVLFESNLLIRGKSRPVSSVNLTHVLFISSSLLSHCLCQRVNDTWTSSLHLLLSSSACYHLPNTLFSLIAFFLSVLLSLITCPHPGPHHHSSSLLSVSFPPFSLPCPPCPFLPERHVVSR